MLVIYRITGIESTNPSPIYQENKNKLNDLCLRSFVRAFKSVKPKMHFIIDHMTGDTLGSIKRIVPFEYTYEVTSMGINKTMLRSYEVAMESRENVVLFQECDYYYRLDTGEQFEEAIKELGLVSPYDHPDFYHRPDIHTQNPFITLVNGKHYRMADRNTMTFGMTRKLFTENYRILKRYGYLDDEVWKELRQNGAFLHTPIPSFATHMVKDYLAPGIPWMQHIENDLGGIC